MHAIEITIRMTWFKRMHQRQTQGFWEYVLYCGKCSWRIFRSWMLYRPGETSLKPIRELVGRKHFEMAKWMVEDMRSSWSFRYKRSRITNIKVTDFTPFLLVRKGCFAWFLLLILWYLTSWPRKHHKSHGSHLYYHFSIRSSLSTMQAGKSGSTTIVRWDRIFEQY